MCVLVARDRAGQTLDWVTGRGQMSKAQLSSALPQPVLAKDALLVSDGNPTYRYFAQDAGISHDAINLSAGVRVNGAVHIKNVNAYHVLQTMAPSLSRGHPLPGQLPGLVSHPGQPSRQLTGRHSVPWHISHLTVT